MGHDYGIDLLIRHRRLIQACIEPTVINFLGDLPDLHAVARAGQEENYGSIGFHNMQIYRILRNFAIHN